MKEIVIVLTAAGPIAGELNTTVEPLLLRPRAIQLVPVGPHQAKVMVSECVGTPQVIRLPKDYAWYVVEDRNILNAYITATTGLQIAGSLPDAPRPD